MSKNLKIFSMKKIFIPLFFIVQLAACGGGGSGSNANSNSVNVNSTTSNVYQNNVAGSVASSVILVNQ